MARDRGQEEHRQVWKREMEAEGKHVRRDCGRQGKQGGRNMEDKREWVDSGRWTETGRWGHILDRTGSQTLLLICTLNLCTQDLCLQQELTCDKACHLETGVRSSPRLSASQ
jgi:hypothetical protein